MTRFYKSTFTVPWRTAIHYSTLTRSHCFKFSLQNRQSNHVFLFNLHIYPVQSNLYTLFMSRHQSKLFNTKGLYQFTPDNVLFARHSMIEATPTSIFYRSRYMLEMNLSPFIVGNIFN
ncbi:hypothetical protein HL42_0945 [Trichophyton rubrum]|nr:hypothetical protein HL42_0945 [Trichophyton rubrum]